MKPYFLENCIQLPRNLINIFNASLNLYKNNFRSTLTISFAATFIQFFSHDFVLRFLSNLLLKLETIHVVPGIMSIIKKKRGEKGGGNRKKRGKKNDNAEAGIFSLSFSSPRYRNGFCSKNFFRPAMVRIGNESCLCMHRKWIIQLFERAPITESVFHFETFIGVDLFSPVVPRLRAVNRQQNLFRGRK